MKNVIFLFQFFKDGKTDPKLISVAKMVGEISDQFKFARVSGSIQTLGSIWNTLLKTLMAVVAFNHPR